jgi:hypothetical protein
MEALLLAIRSFGCGPLGHLRPRGATARGAEGAVHILPAGRAASGLRRATGGRPRRGRARRQTWPRCAYAWKMCAPPRVISCTAHLLITCSARALISEAQNAPGLSRVHPVCLCAPRCDQVFSDLPCLTTQFVTPQAELVHPTQFEGEGQFSGARQAATRLLGRALPRDAPFPRMPLAAET